MKVQIISDFSNIYKDNYDLLITNLNEYVDGFYEIKKAIYNDKNLIVIVRNKYCFNYLNKMYNDYAKNMIEVYSCSVKKELSKILNRKIPDYITDKDILESNVINIMKNTIDIKGENFENIILKTYLGEEFAFNYFPFLEIVELFKKINFKNLEKVSEKSLITKILKMKIELWKINCDNDYQINILEEFSKNPITLIKNISKYTLINSYPETLIRDCIGEKSNDIIKLNLKTNSMPKIEIEKKKLEKNIKIFLSQRNKKKLDKEGILEEIELVSGNFDIEFYHILSVLENSAVEIDRDILDKAKIKFRDINTMDLKIEEKLSKYSPPKEPSKPIDFNKLDEWINWSRNEYFPYRFWMENNDVYNPNVEKYAVEYGDWIHSNYDNMIAEEHRMVFRSIQNLKPNLIEDEISIIVMIDNFNYKFVPFCKDYFNQHEFSSSMDKEIVTMIPTETKISKKAFFSGEAFNENNKSYYQLCKDWESFFDKNFEYWNDINILDRLDTLNSGIYILNYLSIDKELHKSKSESALPIKKRIENELKAIIDKIIYLSKRTGCESFIKIYFISDHGSTKIFNEQKNNIPSNFYKEKTEEPAYRMISLEDNKFNTYKKSIGNICYDLNRSKYGLKYNYLIAKGYNRFLEPKEGTYIHGGITPEENIVPLLKFEKIKIKHEKPELFLRTEEFRYSTLTTINLTLKNFSNYAIKNIVISILNDNIKSQKKEYYIKNIKENSSVDIKIANVRISKSKNQNNILKICIEYGQLEKQFKYNYEFKMIVKSIQEYKTDLNDL